MQLFAEVRRLSENRALSALIAGGALSAFGDWLYLAALPIIVYQATGDAALVGLAAAGRLLPFLLLSMPAGLVADRFDRRGILVVAESLRCGLMLAMGALYVAQADVTVLIAVATAAAAAGTFAMPAQGALIPSVARDENELGLANATSATLENIASIFGPIVAGILVLAGGLGVACLINAISFAVVVALVVRTRPRGARVGLDLPTPDEEQLGAGIEATPGLGEILRRASRPIVLDAAISFACGALGVLPVLIAVDHLGAGEAFAGLLGAGSGIGAVLGGVAAGVLVSRAPSRGLAVGIGIAAASLAAVAATTSPVVAIAATGVALGSLVMLDTLNLTALQRSVPGSHLGRAFGVLHTSAAVWLMAGSAVPPVVAATLGVDTALLLTAMVVACLGGVSIARPPRVRAARRIGVATAPDRDIQFMAPTASD